MSSRGRACVYYLATVFPAFGIGDWTARYWGSHTSAPGSSSASVRVLCVFVCERVFFFPPTMDSFRDVCKRRHTVLVLLNVEAPQQHDGFLLKQAAKDRIRRIHKVTSKRWLVFFSPSSPALSFFRVSRGGSGGGGLSFSTYSEWMENTPPTPPKRSLAHP